jgi:hypothetical protein
MRAPCLKTPCLRSVEHPLWGCGRHLNQSASNPNSKTACTRLRSASSKTDHHLLYMIRGYIYKHNDRANTRRPGAFLVPSNSTRTSPKSMRILHIDDALDVPAFNEQDASRPPKRPEHAFANYLLAWPTGIAGDLDKAQDLFIRVWSRRRPRTRPPTRDSAPSCSPDTTPPRRDASPPRHEIDPSRPSRALYSR